MTDCGCNNFPSSLGNVTFGGSVGVGMAGTPLTNLVVEGTTGLHVRSTAGSPEGGRVTFFGDGTGWHLYIQARDDAGVEHPANLAILTLVDTGLVGVATNAPAYPLDQRYYTDDQMLAAIKAARGTCVRWGIGWDVAEPSPPVNGVHTYIWQTDPDSNVIDYRVNKALQYGLTYIADVGGCPGWANNNDSQKRMPPTGAHTADYQAFITALAEHALGRVRHYECVNEPNGAADWNYPATINNDYDRGQTYAPYLKYFYDAVKAADPAAWVASGGVDSLQGPINFVWGVYAWCYANGYTAPYPFDAVACHPYPQSYPPPQPIDEGSGSPANCPLPQNPPTTLLQGTGLLGQRQLMTCSPYLDYGKPIWLTEYGYHRNNFTPPDGEVLQASNLQAALDWLSQQAYNYITVATFQIAADLLQTSASDMGLLSNRLAAYQAYNTFSSYSKPTS